MVKYLERKQDLLRNLAAAQLVTSGRKMERHIFVQRQALLAAGDAFMTMWKYILNIFRKLVSSHIENVIEGNRRIPCYFKAEAY
jgi:hypothetical protein